MNANVSITDEQMEKLKAISEQTGVAADDLVRQAIDRMIVEKARDEEPMSRTDGWRKELLAVAGIWKDRDDINDLIRSGRAQLQRRHQRLFPDSE